jgi:dTDP-4-amino-4,6-dideoxygalactose transaminase
MVPSPVVPVNDLGRLTKEETTYLTETISEKIRSAVFLRGSSINDLETRIGEYLGGHFALSVANGTDALFVALSALGVKSGDAVATVGNAAGYSTNAILRHRATPIICDIDPISAQISTDSLRSFIKNVENLTALIVTHLYGLLAKVEEIAELCTEFNIKLIEDCAQAFGARIKGSPAGSWGDAATFSFYPTKNLAALGDGGMVAFKDSEACTRARKIAQYGWSSRYEVELPDGINSRLDEIQAAVVLHRLNFVDSRNSRRRDILRRYAEAVTTPRRFIFEDSERCVAHLAVLRTPSRDRDRAVLRSFGIETAIHYPIPDHKQPAWRHLFEGVALPNTESHCAEVLTLPCFPELTEDEIARVCEALGSL